MAQSTYKTIDYTGDTNASSIVLNKPSGVVDGDLMVAIIAWNSGSAYTLTTLSGWTLIRNTNTDSANLNISSFYKIASSEGSSYTWSFSNSVEAVGATIRIDTFNSSTPVDTSNGASTSGGNTTSLTFADTITPSLANELILFPILARNSSARNLTGHSAQAVTTDNPTWTEILDILLDVAGGSEGTMNFSIAYSNRSATTATGNSSATQGSSGSGANKYISQKIAIKNQQAFTFSNSDTVTVTDSETAHTNTSHITTETVTMTDDTDYTKGKDWSNPSKNTSSWTYPDKS